MHGHDVLTLPPLRPSVIYLSSLDTCVRTRVRTVWERSWRPGEQNYPFEGVVMITRRGSMTITIT